MKTGVIGAGAISDIYLSNMIEKFDNLDVVGVAAKHFENAQKKAQKYEIKAYTVEEMLADPAIEMIVVLTPAGTHYELIKAALEAGKHVYTEKTITDDVEKARELLELADRKGLYLGSAPDTFLGSAIQTARNAVDSGLIGEVTSVSAAANRDNNVLLSLFGFLREPGAGITLDYGVYYMAALVNILGPVARTAAFVRTPYPQHKNINPKSPLYGQMMDTPNESEVSAILEFRSGVTGTFLLNADSVLRDQANLIIYGTKGMLYMSDPNEFGGDVWLLENKVSMEDVPQEAPQKRLLPRVNDITGNTRGIGPAEMAKAIQEGRGSRANKELAFHVLEVLDAILQSGSDHTFHEISSTCERPQPYTAV